MPRSAKKGPYIEKRLLGRVQKMRSTGDRTMIKTWSRRSMIVPDLIGTVIHVHDGRRFVPVHITESMVGHKLGEFAHTRTFRMHSGQRKAGAEK